MKKALIYCSVASMIDQFNRDNLQTLQRLGFQVEVACNFQEGNTISQERILSLQEDLTKQGIRFHQIPIPRSPLALAKIWQSYQLTKALFKQEDFQLIHFHSPIGAAIGRLAYKHSHLNQAQIIYTAHGFHFYRGAPLANWILYYPIEFLLANETDILITINSEDQVFAENHLNCKRIEYVPGIGIDTQRFVPEMTRRENMRHQLGLVADEVMLLSVGELNKNKNHREIISILPRLKGNYKYIICGQGAEEQALKDLVQQLGLSQQINFLGYRADIPDILQAADIYCFPSYREGLSVALMEAMASGLPCVVSDIRGNRDLIDDQGGSKFSLGDTETLYQALQSLIDRADLRHQFGAYNRQKMKQFDKEIVQARMSSIYQAAESELNES